MSLLQKLSRALLGGYQPLRNILPLSLSDIHSQFKPLSEYLEQKFKEQKTAEQQEFFGNITNAFQDLRTTFYNFPKRLAERDRAQAKFDALMNKKGKLGEIEISAERVKLQGLNGIMNKQKAQIASALRVLGKQIAKYEDQDYNNK